MAGTIELINELKDAKYAGQDRLALLNAWHYDWEPVLPRNVLAKLVEVKAEAFVDAAAKGVDAADLAQWKTFLADMRDKTLAASVRGFDLQTDYLLFNDKFADFLTRVFGAANIPAPYPEWVLWAMGQKPRTIARQVLGVDATADHLDAADVLAKVIDAAQAQRDALAAKFETDNQEVNAVNDKVQAVDVKDKAAVAKVAADFDAVPWDAAVDVAGGGL